MRRIDKNNLLRVANTLFVLVLIFMISGCSPILDIQTKNPPSEPTKAGNPDVTISTVTSMVAETIASMAQSTPRQTTIERIGYSFEVDLDYNKHTLVVRQTIHYKNQTGQELSEIPLMIPPNRNPNVFSLNSLALTGDVGLEEDSLDGAILSIQFDKPLSVTGSVDIGLEYKLKPRLQGGVLGYTAKQLNLSDWYPFVPPYIAGSGWIIHKPAEVGEFLVYDCSDFDLTLNLVNPTGLVIAGSTEVAPLDLDSFRMEQVNARGITFSVSDQYTVLTKTIDDLIVKGYIFEGDEIAGQAAVDYTASALQLYSEIFGLSYPRQTLSVIESDFPDGMEYDGLYYLSDFYFKNYDGTFQNYLALLSVHETSHQWWFGAVANDQALEPWLDESLATYSEYLYIEHFYPELINWWWDYRVNYYKPAGKVNLTIYDQPDLRTYINAVYLQGAVFLDQLRQELGDEAFFAGLKSYANTYNHKITTWNEFRKIMAPDPSEAINALLTEYFR